MSKFVGSWDVESTDNFEEYMKALGVGMVMRKMGNSVKPTVIISVDGDTWSLKAESTFKSTEIKFELGKEFAETTADGRNVKSTITLEGDNKMIHAQVADPPSTLTRELVDDNTLKLTMEAKGVVATRVYKRKA